MGDDGPTTAVAGLYDSFGNGNINSLLAISTPVSIGTGLEMVEFNFTTNVNVADGKYWIAIQAANGRQVQAESASFSEYVYITDAYDGNLPSVFSGYFNLTL